MTPLPELRMCILNKVRKDQENGTQFIESPYPFQVLHYLRPEGKGCTLSRKVGKSQWGRNIPLLGWGATLIQTADEQYQPEW